MHLDYKQVFHFLFPPSEDELLIADTTQTSFLNLSKVQETKNVVSLLPYNDPHVRAAVHLAKFHNHAYAKKLLSVVLAQYLLELDSYTKVLVPIPLSVARKRKRGYNQVEEIITGALKIKFPEQKMARVLKRTRNTVPQTSLSREERLDNMVDAFDTVRKGMQTIAGKHVLLIDDVTTTGATLSAAKVALASLQPASITCIALAH